MQQNHTDNSSGIYRDIMQPTMPSRRKALMKFIGERIQQRKYPSPQKGCFYLCTMSMAKCAEYKKREYRIHNYVRYFAECPIRRLGKARIQRGDGREVKNEPRPGRNGKPISKKES